MLKSVSEIRLENVEKLMQETGLDRASFAEKFNTTYNMFSQYFTTGKSRKVIGDKKARSIEEAYDKPKFWLDNEHDGLIGKISTDGQTHESLDIRPVIDMDEGDLEDDEFEYPHFYESYSAGGSNELPVIETDKEPSRLKKSTARRAGASMSHTFSYNLDGDSMSPKILDKAIVTADASKKQIKDGKIYLFRHGVMRRTKYLYNRPDGGLLVRSENSSDYPDEIIKGTEMGDVEILGWVYHWCNTETW